MAKLLEKSYIFRLFVLFTEHLKVSLGEDYMQFMWESSTSCPESFLYAPQARKEPGYEVERSSLRLSLVLIDRKHRRCPLSVVIDA
jgi:hypothetical protein